MLKDGLKDGFLCLPVVDEAGEKIFVPEGFRLSKIETDRTSYLLFSRSSEGVWEELYMYFYTDRKVIVYHIEYTKEIVNEDFSHSIYTQEFSTFGQLREFFRIELAKAG